MGCLQTSAPSRRAGVLSLLAGVVGTALLALGPRCQAEGLSEVQKQQLQVHMTLLAKLQAYTPAQQFTMVYGLVAKANERDRDRHRKQAENLMAKAEEARTRNDGSAQELAKAARGYKTIAELNHKIAQAFQAKSQDAMDEAITELQTACAQVEKATGKPVPRDWFTPGESEAYALAEMVRQQQQKQPARKAQ